MDSVIFNLLFEMFVFFAIFRYHLEPNIIFYSVTWTDQHLCDVCLYRIQQQQFAPGITISQHTYVLNGLLNYVTYAQNTRTSSVSKLKFTLISTLILVNKTKKCFCKHDLYISFSFEWSFSQKCNVSGIVEKK